MLHINLALTGKAVSEENMIEYWRPVLTVHNIGQGHHKAMIYIHIVALKSSLLHVKFRRNRSTGSGDYEGFYHIRSWRPSWSCDLDYLYILV